MTNSLLLRNFIEKSGYKMCFIAESIGLSYQGFLNKIKGDTEFTAKEIYGLCVLLKINKENRDEIFFAPKVDETSTETN